jgi:ribosome-binding factor A
VKRHDPPAPGRRLQRVSELLKREVSELLRRELGVEEVGLLTVNEVKVAPDLKTATVFVGHVGARHQREALPERLARSSPRIQSMLGAHLSTKWTPVLTFLLDESVEKGNRVLAILEELEKPAPRRTA